MHTHVAMRLIPHLKTIPLARGFPIWITGLLRRNRPNYPSDKKATKTIETVDKPQVPTCETMQEEGLLQACLT
jgi:hypothetical protein